MSILSGTTLGTIGGLSSSAATLRPFASVAWAARRQVSIPISAAVGQMANAIVRLIQLKRVEMDS